MAQQIAEITKVPTNTQVIKILNEVIKRYNSLGSIYTFKGSVQTYDDLLAIENPEIGDVYNVIQEDEEHQIAAGSNFVWDGTVWDNLGGSLAGLVQSVNGINPDSLGNVLLPLIKNITTNQGAITFTKNDDTTIQVDNIKKLYTVGLGQTVDLNNLVEAGIYMCGNNSYAANYENCPVQKSFLLEVQQANDGSMVYQFLTQYNDGSTEASNQYVRTYQVTNGWSAWRMAGSGSNLTTYTSLEQIGITPGEETLESIHNALPLNSEIAYYRTVSTVYNHDIYPAKSNYGYFKATKLWNNVTKFEYLQYTTTANTGDDSTTSPYINVGVLWSTYLDATTTYKPVWNKSYTQQLQTFVQKVNNKLPDEGGNVSLFDISNVTSIPADSNLNDYIKTGRYACVLTTRAQSLLNNPMSDLSTGIILEVIVSGSFVFQILYGTLIRGMYVRRRTLDGDSYSWNSWKNINNGIAHYNLSDTGWSQFENGLIFAWKVVTADNRGNKVITKPTSFTTYSVTFGDRGDGSSDPSIPPMVRYDLTTNTTDTIIGSTSSASNAYYMFWVGYKKVVD